MPFINRPSQGINLWTNRPTSLLIVWHLALGQRLLLSEGSSSSGKWPKAAAVKSARSSSSSSRVKRAVSADSRLSLILYIQNRPLMQWAILSIHTRLAVKNRSVFQLDQVEAVKRALQTLAFFPLHLFSGSPDLSQIVLRQAVASSQPTTQQPGFQLLIRTVGLCSIILPTYPRIGYIQNVYRCKFLFPKPPDPQAC